jgi:hypothetical protein
MSTTLSPWLCRFALIGAVALLPACATSGATSLPKTTQANLSQNTLKIAVGTANIAGDGVTGLNVVASLRQPDGLSATLANQPVLTGPFVVPADLPSAYYSSSTSTPGSCISGTNVDAGTNHISGSPQVPLNNAGLVQSSLGTFTGVFSYGFGPFNTDQVNEGSAYYPGVPNSTGGNGFECSIYDGSSQIAIANAHTGTGSQTDPTAPQPYFGTLTFDYLVGPPAVPFFNNGTFPPGFAGYSPGFTVFEIPPAAGSYNLKVHVAATNASPITYSASATLGNVTPLATLASPTFTEDGAGGGSGTITLGDPRITEAMAFIVDGTAGTFYSVSVPVTGANAGAFTLPDNLGACVGAGCQNGASASASIAKGDTYFVAVVGYDYPAFELGPPGNTQASPALPAQADLTMSPFSPLVYGGASSARPFKPQAKFHQPH